MKRLAIVSTHPIQYSAPWFRLLAEQPDVDLHVFYTAHGGEQEVYDAGFGRALMWDVSLTEGYDYTICPPSQAIHQRTFWNMNSPDLLPKLRAWQPDCVLVIGWNFRSHFRCMRAFKGRVPVWFRGDSTLLDERCGWKARLRPHVLRYIFSHIDVALAVGANNRDYFLAYGLAGEQIALARHAIDNERFSDPGHDAIAAAVRQKMGIDNQHTVVSFVGKLESKKSPLDLVNAFERACQHRGDLRLLIAGSGPLEATIASRIAGNDCIHRMPFQNQLQIPAVYRVGDITCLPSHYDETWGLCLNESMACGRAILTSNKVGAARDLVNDNTGFAYPAGNTEELADILKTLPPRAELLQMGAACQSFIAKYSFSGIVSTIVSLLHGQPK